MKAQMSQIFCMIILKCILVHANYSFYEIIAFNNRERYWLYKLYESRNHINFLNGVTNEAATAMNVIVDDCCTDTLEVQLENNDIEYSCVARNVSLKHDSIQSYPLMDVSQHFLNWEDILIWVTIQEKHHSVFRKIVIAKTYENRDIFILKLSNGDNGKKISIFIVAGEEGRDWLSSALTLNYINRILESANSPKSLLNYYDFYILPIINPDGFVYSKYEDRLWAKNRKEIRPAKQCEDNETALGINIDRNWLVEKTASSEGVCNSTYGGFKSLSEEETQGLSFILNSIALKLLAFINVRGFETLITLPYSNEEEESNNLNIMMEIMKHVSQVLRRQYNITYPVGTTADYFYNFSGNMADWVKRMLNIPVVFTVYMKKGKFLPKESHIVPLTKQLHTLINVTLAISTEIYGSLYNMGVKNTYMIMLILTSYFCKISMI